jgi:hypothetical protein
MVPTAFGSSLHVNPRVSAKSGDGRRKNQKTLKALERAGCALALCLAPPRDRGGALLAKDGDVFAIASYPATRGRGRGVPSQPICRKRRCRRQRLAKAVISRHLAQLEPCILGSTGNSFSLHRPQIVKRDGLLSKTLE